VERELIYLRTITDGNKLLVVDQHGRKVAFVTSIQARSSHNDARRASITFIEGNEEGAKILGNGKQTTKEKYCCKCGTPLGLYAMHYTMFHPVERKFTDKPFFYCGDCWNNKQPQTRDKKDCVACGQAHDIGIGMINVGRRDGSNLKTYCLPCWDSKNLIREHKGGTIGQDGIRKLIKELDEASNPFNRMK
jgi:ribosomal protein S14